jgi:molybdate transport system substrate-binding protein
MRIVVAAAALAYSIAASAARATDLMVYAAVSLTEALQENARDFEKAGGEHVDFSFGASNTLALQIQEGAPADLFFSADEAKMDGLEKRGLLAPGTRHSLLSNVLAIVVEKGSSLPIHAAADLTRSEVRHIALAEPTTVPAGIYAKEYLKSLDLWTKVIDKVVPTESVRAALAAVEAGNCEAGIVYRTDAAISKKVQVAFEVPAEEGPRISYPVAMLRATKHAEAAKGFLEYLRSAPARQVFEAHGFSVLTEP